MCRCAERRAIIGHSVTALVQGDLQTISDDISAFNQTIRDDLADAKVASMAALASARARLSGMVGR